MPSPHNPLWRNEFPAIPGWSVVVFLAALPLIGVPGFWLLPDRTMLPLLTLFFTVGLLAVLVAVAPLGWNALPALGLRRTGWRTIVLGILGTTVLSFAVSQLGMQPEGVRQVTDAVVRDPAQLLATLAVLALLAPLVEELVFRGLVYGWLSRWGSGFAVVASSLAFAAAHVEPAHILLVLPLGLWFGWLRRRTDSLLPPLAAHMVNNGLAVAAAAYLGT